MKKSTPEFAGIQLSEFRILPISTDLSISPFWILDVVRDLPHKNGPDSSSNFLIFLLQLLQDLLGWRKWDIGEEMENGSCGDCQARPGNPTIGYRESCYV